MGEVPLWGSSGSVTPAESFHGTARCPAKARLHEFGRSSMSWYNSGILNAHVASRREPGRDQCEDRVLDGPASGGEGFQGFATLTISLPQ